MKIVTGVTNYTEAEYFAQRADELYCGVSGLANHRDGQRNVASLRELERIAGLAARRGKPLHVAANEVYAPGEYPAVIGRMEDCVRAGAGGFIVRDAGLLHEVRERGLETKFVLSSLGLCFNRETLKFFSGLGVSRVVLPQHLEAAEAAGLLRNGLSVETEIFYFPQCCCPNVDGACPYHTLYRAGAGQTCRRPFTVGGRRFVMKKPDPVWMLGMLYDYFKAGCDCIKISRDGFEAERAAYDEIREAVALLESGTARKDFVERLRVKIK